MLSIDKNCLRIFSKKHPMPIDCSLEIMQTCLTKSNGEQNPLSKVTYNSWVN